MARQLAPTLGIEFLRFDMSRVHGAAHGSRLIGAPPGYVGFDQGGLLTDAVDKNPHAVVLLDEIEKAHPDVYNILLQVMDHGTLTDNNGKQGRFPQRDPDHDHQRRRRRHGAAQPIGFGRGRTRGRGRGGDQAHLHAGVPQPARRHRGLRPLPPEVIVKVVHKFVMQLEAQLADRHVTIELSDEARLWLAKNGYDESMGARPLARVIQEHIKKPLADEILFGRLKNGGTVRVVTAGSGDDARLAFVFPDGPVLPRPDKELVEARRKKAPASSRKPAPAKPDQKRRRHPAGPAK